MSRGWALNEEGGTTTNFFYDNLDLDDPDSVLQMGAVEAEAWQDDGFLLQLPSTMPTGTGALHVNLLSIPAKTADCPFAAYDLVASRGMEAGGISVVEP